MPTHTQIIDGKMRLINAGENDIVATPPGSEIIYEQTIGAIVAATGISVEELAATVVSARGLVDERYPGSG